MGYIVTEFFKEDSKVWSPATIIGLANESDYLVDYNGSRVEVQQKNIRFIVIGDNQDITIGSKIEYKKQEGWSKGTITGAKGSFVSIELPDSSVIVLRKSELRIVEPISLSYLEFEVKIERSNSFLNKSRIDKLMREIVKNCIFVFTSSVIRVLNTVYFANEDSNYKQNCTSSHANMVYKSLILLKESVELLIKEEVASSNTILC